jgi:hypothetical protein
LESNEVSHAEEVKALQALLAHVRFMKRKDTQASCGNKYAAWGIRAKQHNELGPYAFIEGIPSEISCYIDKGSIQAIIDGWLWQPPAGFSPRHFTVSSQHRRGSLKFVDITCGCSKLATWLLRMTTLM